MRIIKLNYNLMKSQILENWVAVMAVIFERNIILNLVEAHIQARHKGGGLGGGL